MVAQFLRLKLRLLGNIFRRSPWQVVGIVLGLVYGVGLATLLFFGLVGLRFVEDVTVIRDVFVVAGAAVVLGFVVFPLAFGVGPGAELRQALGVAVFFGMIGVTLFGLVFTPVFYVLCRRLALIRPKKT